MSSDPEAHPTLIRTEGARTSPDRRPRSWTLPPDLLAEAVRRVRTVALLYALAYALAALVPPLVFPNFRPGFFEGFHWIPAVLSIAMALALAAIVSSRRFSPEQDLRAGLTFEVLGSFGIAAAEYQHVASPLIYRDLGSGGFGLSWVAAWVLLFSVAVPAPPRVTMTAAALSLAAVPLSYALGVTLGTNLALGPVEFFLTLVFPYLIVLLMVRVGSRVVSGLGAEVRKARDMGSYRLVERLGEGGMGEVWRAQHRLLARPAAIKLIRPGALGATELDGRQMLRRFEREAQATALMRSPHTLELYDFGVADDGTFYYVMELLDGFDLDDLVGRFGPVPAERAVHFLRQICASLGEAHDAGLIHRDIKPANLYACRYGREVDFIKVLDFGLVKHGGVPEEGADRITGEHTAGGTPAFMSPEQAVGGDDVDGRSDLYSVGCVAYWLLTGTAVFQGRTPIETMMMHVHRQPEPPSRRAGRPMPAELEAIVLSCLAKEPANRPQTADELAARLARVPAAGEWTAERARRWWDSHRPVTTRISLPG
ncbi:MAG TPA: serine/threonine-protein kinase [Gemmatimonadales bacterium]|nr:serine/threonine-protein kinase [Gemmatimonadales bacterium]